MNPTPSSPTHGSTRAVFLDRDGTINVDRHYLSDPNQFELIPGAAGALRQLMDAGFRLFVVTNQSGIGRGYYSEYDMHRVNQRMLELLAPAGIQFEHIYFSPEAPEVPSYGRKPSPRFLHDARDQFGVDLSRSFMIGDKFIDVQTGWNAGTQASILVRTGYGRDTELKETERLSKATVVDDLSAAARWILGQP